MSDHASSRSHSNESQVPGNNGSSSNGAHPQRPETGRHSPADQDAAGSNHALEQRQEHRPALYWGEGCKHSAGCLRGDAADVTVRTSTSTPS